jgi:hypothetical protein
MEAQHNGADGFDGVEASFEYPLDGGHAGTAKASIRASKGTVFFLVVGAAVILDKTDALERLLDAVPALAGRAGDRLGAAT